MLALQDQIGAWIGLHDRGGEAGCEGSRFQWTDGTANDFQNWGEGEPNDWADGEAHCEGSGDEDCVMFGFQHSSQGALQSQWNDAECHTRMPYVCGLCEDTRDCQTRCNERYAAATELSSGGARQRLSRASVCLQLRRASGRCDGRGPRERLRLCIRVQHCDSGRALPGLQPQLQRPSGLTRLRLVRGRLLRGQLQHRVLHGRCRQVGAL